MADPSITIGLLILNLAVGISFLAAFLINVFIVAANTREWKKGRPMTTADNVITSLGISRMVFQLVCMLNATLYICFYRLGILGFASVKFFELSSNYSNIWLSTLLSLVFCLKICPLHNAFFLWLKSLVLNRVFHLILASVVLSVGYAFFFCLMMFVETPSNSTYEIYRNVFTGGSVSGIIFLASGPLLICFISSVLLIIYLYLHISRMRSERSGTSHLDTYYKTIKFTGFSLFCSVVYIIANLTFPDGLHAFSLSAYYLFWNVFPTLHSMYLIYVTAKLRVQVSNMVGLLKRRCCVPTAQVETVF